MPLQSAPGPGAFKPALRPCRSRTAELIRQDRVNKLQDQLKDIAAASAPTAQPTAYPITLMIFCKQPGTCYPRDTNIIVVADETSRQILIQALPFGYHLVWIPGTPTNTTDIFNALRSKWQSTGSPL